MSDQRHPIGAGFAFDNAQSALDEQLERIEALGAKAGILLAADGVLAGLLFAADSVLLEAPRLIGVAVAIPLLLSFLLALLAFFTRKYETAPRREAVIGLMKQGDETWLKWRFLGNLVQALDINRSKLDSKGRHVSAAIALLFVVVALLGGYLAYALAAGTLS